MSSDATSESTDASSRGYGSGASESGEYSCKKADEDVLPWVVKRSMNVWYAISLLLVFVELSAVVLGPTF